MKPWLLRRPLLTDVPSRLRAMAERVESNPELYRSAVLTLCRDDQCVEVYGFGERSSPLEASGWLARAQAVLASGCAPDEKGEFGSYGGSD